MDTNFVPHKVDKLPEKTRVNTSKSIFTGELMAEMQSNPSDWYLVTRVEVLSRSRTPPAVQQPAGSSTAEGERSLGRGTRARVGKA